MCGCAYTLIRGIGLQTPIIESMMPAATSPLLTIALLLTAGMAAVVLGWALSLRIAARRASHRRIHGARVRAGLVPRDIPTLPGQFAESDAGETLASEQELRSAAESAVVDEKPVVRLKYLDRNGQRVRCSCRSRSWTCAA